MRFWRVFIVLLISLFFLYVGSKAYASVNYINQWGGPGSGPGQFNQPLNVALDSSGNVYVTDAGNNRVQKFSSDGIFIQQFTATNAAGITIDASNNVYVSDYVNNEIYIFGADGSLLSTFGDNTNLEGPFSLTSDDSRIYAVNVTGGAISQFSLDGVFEMHWGDGELYYPWGITQDSEGDFFITNFLRDDVAIYDNTHTGITSISGFDEPAGISMDPSFDLYVANTHGNNITRVDFSHSDTSTFGSAGTGNGQFNSPAGVKVNSAGLVYVVDSGNNRVQVFQDSAFITPTPLPVSSTVSWHEIQPGGDNNYDWSGSGISSNGQDMIAGVNGGRIYLSTNGGGSWSETMPAGDRDGKWIGVGMSNDGQTIIAANYAGRVYVSDSGGSSWSDAQPSGDTDANWYSATVNGSGQIMLAGLDSGRLYLSTDGGSSWSETQPAGDVDKTWLVVAADQDGQVLIAGAYGGRLYKSSDSGANWTEIQPAEDTDYAWTAAGISGDGQTILAGGDGSREFISTDGGDNWQELQLDGNMDHDWRINRVSADGQELFAGNGNNSLGRLYISTGTSDWTETQPAGDNDFFWNLGSLSGNGQTLLAGSNNGRLYIGSLPLPTLTPTPQPAGGNSSSQSPGSTVTCSTQPIGAPDLFQINTAKNSATVFFSPVAGATNYQISYGFTSAADQFNVFTNQGQSSGVSSFTINDLPINSVVYFKVYAQNNCGQGVWSNVMQVKTVGGGIFYKNFAAQLQSDLIPHKTTKLSQTTKPTPVKPTKVINPKSPTPKLSASKSASVSKAESAKKSCFLFICW